MKTFINNGDGTVTIKVESIQPAGEFLSGLKAREAELTADIAKVEAHFANMLTPLTEELAKIQTELGEATDKGIVEAVIEEVIEAPVEK